MIRRLSPRISILSVAALLASSGCGTRDLSVPDAEAYPPTFSALRERVLRPRCASCHPKILLHSAVLSDLVVAGHPEKSDLFTEIDSGGMPKYGGKLTDPEIDAVRTWIAKGAPND